MQDLLQRVHVEPEEAYTERFPEEHACRVTLVTHDGGELTTEKRDYEGWHSRPMSWETVGWYVDIFKFSGESFSLMPRKAVRELIDICHEHDVQVSTGGFIETIVTMEPEAVEKYLEECRDLGFHVVEASSGFLSIPIDDLVRLTEQVQAAGMKAKPEINIRFGAGGVSAVEALEREGSQDPGRVQTYKG